MLQQYHQQYLEIPSPEAHPTHPIWGDPYGTERWISTNLLAMPLVHIRFETGNNEDWIDGINYVTPFNEPVDLRGIDFHMQIRNRPDEYDVSLYPSTVNKLLIVSYNCLVIHIPLWKMENIWTVAEYVGDILGSDGHFFRVVATFDLRVIHGVTR
jgi:hypothetical protein